MLSIDLKKLNSIYRDNQSSPLVIQSTCHMCGLPVSVQIFKTSGGYGLNNGALYVTADGNLLVRCTSCTKANNGFIAEIWNGKRSYFMDRNLYDHGGRRSGIERRKIVYDLHVPERRSGIDRRSGFDRRQPADAPATEPVEKARVIS